jgi:signal transduction histidine kinase
MRKNYLHSRRYKKQNTQAASLHYRSFTFVLLIQTTVRTLMSESQDPLDANEVARLRALVFEYETKLTDAASLMARVRHEINNPLAALLGQAQLLLRDELSEKLRRRAETIESQAKRIEEIVSELREVQLPVAASHRQQE